MEVSGQPNATTSLPLQKKTPRTHSARTLGGSQSQFGCYGEEIDIFLDPAGI